MKNEIVKLLRKEGKLSDEAIDEIEKTNINNFVEIIKEIGKEKREHIKSSEISKDLNTKFIGKNLYIYHEVSSTNTVAKFLSQNGVENGSIVISEKQTGGKARCHMLRKLCKTARPLRNRRGYRRRKHKPHPLYLYLA